MNEKIFEEKLKSCRELLRIQINAITNILERRLVFERLDEIIKSNPSLKVYNLFWDWYFYNYIDSQVMELMRILDQDPSSKNFMRMLDSLISGFNMDKNFFQKIKNSIPNPDNIPENIMRALIPLLNINTLKCDRELLEEETNVESVRNYRDWKVAHTDSQKWKNLELNLTKLNECINLVHTKILHYDSCLTGSGHDTDKGYTPSIHYDWESIFRVPWISK